MKLFLLLMSFCFFITAPKSQNINEEPINKEKADAILKYYGSYNKPEVLILDSLNKWRNKNFSIMSKKHGVYRLLQHGMPCIVPDTKDIVAIPNVFKGKASVPFVGKTPHIPNPLNYDLRFRSKKYIPITVLPYKK